MARTCNLILIVLDATRPAMHKKVIENELEGFGIRLNKKAPNILLKKKGKVGGGIDLIFNVKQTKISNETIMTILKEYKMINMDVIFNCDADEDDLIDVLEGNRRYMPCM